jgi:rSAM/selenodomain-associated transferase 2
MNLSTSFKLSVIIPTYNEQEGIQQLVAFIVQHGAADVCEIIVVDGGSTDSTCEHALRAGASVLKSEIRARANQMNLGAKAAVGNILYFVHADVKLLPSFVQDIKESIQLGYPAGCYRYQFDSDTRILKLNAYFTRFDRLICRGGDQTLFVIKEVFDKLNGFNEDYVVMEDYDFIVRLRKEYSFRIIPKNVLVSARKYATNSWLRVQIANLVAFGMFYLKVNPLEIKKTYGKLLTYR